MYTGMYSLPCSDDTSSSDSEVIFAHVLAAALIIRACTNEL